MKKIFLIFLLSLALNATAQEEELDFPVDDSGQAAEAGPADQQTEMPSVEEMTGQEQAAEQTPEQPQDNSAQIQTFGAEPAAPVDATPSLGTDQMLEQNKGDMFSQAEAKRDLKLQAKSVDLRTVLATGLNRNVNQKVRNYLYEKIELTWDDTFESFWFPNIKLTVGTGNQLLQTIRRSSSLDSATNSSPVGSVGLELGEYTLFNWGRDYLEYVNDKASYERNKQKLTEEKRLLRFNLIAQYFRLVRAKNIQKWRQEQLRHTSFVHRLARQKLSLKQIGTQEYYLTRAEYLRAQSLFQESQADTIKEDETLAFYLGDSLETTYKPTEELKFIGINTSVEESIKLALTQSPNFRDARLDMENSNRSFQKAQKDNLPLPKINLNLGAYRSNFSNNGRSTEFEGYDGSRDVEVVATLNFTWNIVGEGGLFNSRERQQAYLDKRISEERFQEAKRMLAVKIRTMYRRIRYIESQSEVSETQLKNAQSAFDSTLDNYISGKSNFANLKISLERIMEAHINYETSKFDHLLLKLELSDLMGLEDFPGSNFENLAERI